MSSTPDLVTRARERFAVRDYHGATLLLQEAVVEGFAYADAFNLLGLSLALIVVVVVILMTDLEAPFIGPWG